MENVAQNDEGNPMLKMVSETERDIKGSGNVLRNKEECEYLTCYMTGNAGQFSHRSRRGLKWQTFASTAK